jgi:hypothetical protein
MLKKHAEKLGKKVEIIVHGDIKVERGSDLYDLIKNK